MKAPALLLAALVPALSGAGSPAPPGRIDEAVSRQLKKLGVLPAGPCSDAVFLRRVYLDVIGTLPTAEEARRFLEDKDPNRRSVLIDHLLQRREYADYWAMKWSDLLRVKAEFPINLWPNAAQVYYLWIRQSLRENMPVDRFARELITSSGSNFRVPPVNFYRALQSQEPPAVAQAAALAFMGTRAEKWEKERLQGLAAFFCWVGFKRTAEWKEEIVFFDAVKAAADAAAGRTPAAVFPDGTPARLSPDKDPREAFADWLLSPKNPWFARSIANRAWSWLMGRGVVHEPDDLRPDNPPANPELLDVLEKELVAARYDMKRLFRLILNSQTYQRTSVPRTLRPEAEAQFAHYPVRRLDAEVLIDALCQVTGTTEEYSSLIPEPFTFIPEDHRSIALPDGSITSPFLEMFGRPPRDTGLESERNNAFTAAQRLHLLNSTHILKKIERSPRLRALALSARINPLKAMTELYLTVLSRFPTEQELRTVKAHADSTETRGAGFLVDLIWALVNSAEFLYRH